MKSQDVVILLKLVSLEHGERGHPRLDVHREDPFSVRGLGASLGISKTEVNASVNRSIASGLAVKDRNSGRPKPNRRNLCNFIVHGLKFVFPARPGAMTRGVPTAFAAPSLKSLLISAGEYIYVWPFAKGKIQGQSLEPLFKSVPEAVQKDERLYEYLALVDAIRIGNQRETGVAVERISERLLKSDQR
ncbi:hypothetical protein SAMN05216337_108219 [Bradyrhizobium brasilense]|uniref:Uncharacterized protein n=1 Tax=Bradyrhizobium brasilense TaxID=1419277 RepID=A0A1G7PRJ7_9BRAD|nr:hypothetical protein [Bradyrhizobium brasilense]SDF88040.1 hypothetical protein SAMN05216337_108219 [Bradyrhizobium brasilense]